MRNSTTPSPQSAEFITTLVVGALLTLAGPLVITYSTTHAQNAAVQIDVAEKERQTNEATLKIEAKRAEAKDKT